MLALGSPELGDHGVEAELVDGRAVDPADERVSQARHDRVPEAPPKEPPDRDILAGRRAREDEIPGHGRRLRGEKRRVFTNGAIRVGSTRPIPSGAARTGRLFGCGRPAARWCR